MIMTIAALLVVASALSFYLAAPRQQWLARPLQRWAALPLGSALIAIAWWLQAKTLAVHTLIFTVLTLLMLACGLIPYVVIGLRHLRKFLT